MIEVGNSGRVLCVINTENSNSFPCNTEMAGESETSPVVEEVEKPSAITPVAPLTTKTTADADKHSLVLHLTGFGPFQGVPDNPTSTLMQILPSYLSLGDRPLPPSVKCASFTVLETSFKGSRSQLGVIQETGASAYTGGHTIYLHIGTKFSRLAGLHFRFRNT